MWTLPVPPRLQPAFRPSERKGTSKHGRRLVTIEGVPRRATCRTRIVWSSYLYYQQQLRILPLILDVDAPPHRPPRVQRQLVLGMDVLRAPVRLVHALEGVLLVAGEAH